MEEINEKKTHKWKTIKRLLKYVAPYKWKTIGIILMLLLIMSCNTLNPYLMKVSIDKFVSGCKWITWHRSSFTFIKYNSNDTFKNKNAIYE